MSQATPAATPAPASVATSVDTKLGQSLPPPHGRGQLVDRFAQVAYVTHSRKLTDRCAHTQRHNDSKLDRAHLGSRSATARASTTPTAGELRSVNERLRGPEAIGYRPGNYAARRQTWSCFPQ